MSTRKEQTIKKVFIKGIMVLTLLFSSLGLTGCGLVSGMLGSILQGETPEYNMVETNTESSSEEIADLLQDKTLTDLLMENVDQSVLEYRGKVMYHTNPEVVQYSLYLVSNSNEDVEKEIRKVYEVLDQYLQSDDYNGEAISIAIMTDSIHCHASNYVAAIGNVDYSYNYYGKKEIYTVEDHISHIEPYGIDEEAEIYDENIDYLINQESFWSEFEADCVNFDYFNL